MSHTERIDAQHRPAHLLRQCRLIAALVRRAMHVDAHPGEQHKEHNLRRDVVVVEAADVA